MRHFLVIFLILVNVSLFGQTNSSASNSENPTPNSQTVGTGRNYDLGNRKAVSKAVPKYTCNETGKVVVEISVDRAGKTVSATTGIEGSTTNAKCLLDEAQIAAMNTKWQPSQDAPEKQVGSITYNFSLN